VNPLTGLPGKLDWIPSLRQVKEALEETVAPIVRRERIEQQAEQRRREIVVSERVHAQPRPSKEEIEAQYGPNYGLQQSARQEEEEARAKRQQRMRETNERFLRRECLAAGVDPARASVTPSLERLMRGSPAPAFSGSFQAAPPPQGRPTADHQQSNSIFKA
jgi:hypothetical protein